MFRLKNKFLKGLLFAVLAFPSMSLFGYGPTPDLMEQQESNPNREGAGVTATPSPMGHIRGGFYVRPYGGFYARPYGGFSARPYYYRPYYYNYPYRPYYYRYYYYPYRPYQYYFYQW